MYINICICISRHIYIYIYICMNIKICFYTHTHTHTHIILSLSLSHTHYQKHPVLVNRVRDSQLRQYGLRRPTHIDMMDGLESVVDTFLTVFTTMVRSQTSVIGSVVVRNTKNGSKTVPNIFSRERQEISNILFERECDPPLQKHKDRFV